MSRVLRRLAAVAGLIGLLAVPSGASVRDATVCDSSVAAVGRCDVRRPSPSIRAQPAAPHAGSPLVLSATSPGRGVTYAWDLDGDGAYDDADGATATTTLAAGTRTVAVRATDADGRRGSEARTLPVHAANLRPSGRFVVLTPSPGPARVTDVEIDGTDPDGHVVRIEYDLEGDGSYEGVETFEPGEPAHVEAGLRDPIVGTHTLHARLVDDTGATTVLSADMQVHRYNLPPRVSVAVAPGVAKPGEPVTLSADALDPDGPQTGLAFDLDADGTYETEASGATSMTTTFAKPGVYEVGVQARDDDGSTSISRRSVQVEAEPGQPFEIASHAGPLRPGVEAGLQADGAVAWDMDDDGAFDDAVGSAPAFAFATAGTFTVRARTASGRTAMRTVTVVDDARIAPAVTELGLPAVIRAGVPVAFTALAVDPEDDPVKLTFDLDGDGVFDDVPEFAAGAYHWTFPASGPITVAVRATDSTGRSGDRTAVVEPTDVDLAPDATLAIGDLVAGRPAALAAEVSDAAAVSWDTEGDGAFDDPATFTPPASGDYTLRARVVAAGGAATTVARTVTAGSRPPVAAFSSSDDAPEPGEPVTLTASATDPDGAALSLAWDLDDDGAFDDAVGASAAVTFAAGDHVVGLEARDPGGDVGVRYVTLPVRPAATPTPTPTATPTATATASATATATATATPTATATETAAPALTPAATVTPVGPPTFATPTPVPGPRTEDRSPPALAAVARSSTRAGLLAHGLRIDTRCSEACTFTVVASVDAATAKRLGLGRGRELGQARTRLGARARTAVPVRLSARAKRGVKRAHSLKIKLAFTAIDAVGNRTVASATLAVRAT